MANQVQETLIERAQHYDTSEGQAWKIAGEVLCWFYDRGLLKRIISSSYGFAWVIILTKLVRIAQDPYHKENWLDISGYAQLVMDQLALDQSVQKAESCTKPVL